MSCFGCHFKIKNFTMSTCLLLLYCYVPQSMIKIISWNRFHGKTCRGKNFYPPTHTLIMPPIVYCRPLPLIAAMSSTYICIIKKISFSADQKHGNIFPFSRILTSNIYALSLNPQKSKKNLRGLLEKRKKTIKKMCLMKKFTICWCLEEKKVLLKMEFFLPCSRATSSEEQNV